MAKILIMDDEPSLRNILATTVSSMGHTVVTAEDGKQAIELAKKDNPDILLLDLQVPDMDGLEVLKELKTINPSFKCVMLSGTADVQMAITAMKKGASDFIAKPFKIDEIKRVVNKVLAMKTADIPTLSNTVSQAPASTTQASQPQQTQNAQVSQKTFKQPLSKAQNSNKNMIMLIAGCVIAVIALIFIGKSLFTSSTFKEYTVPYANPTGLCFIKSDLWVTDWISGNIYQHTKDEKLSIASVQKTANLQPTGIAYSGDNIWTCNSTEQKIYKHKADSSLSVEAVFSNPESNPVGMYFDGVNLFVLDSSKAKIYKHKIDSSLSISSVYDCPAQNPCGMFKAGDYYYIGDYKSAKIYKVSIKDFTLSEVFAIQYFVDQQYKLAGLAWDGKNIWASADEKGKIYCLSFSKLKSIKF
jgi:DNA-binding response OmpR family regulator